MSSWIRLGKKTDQDKAMEGLRLTASKIFEQLDKELKETEDPNILMIPKKELDILKHNWGIKRYEQNDKLELPK
jgi:hypothetical protein